MEPNQPTQPAQVENADQQTQVLPDSSAQTQAATQEAQPAPTQVTPEQPTSDQPVQMQPAPEQPEPQPVDGTELPTSGEDAQAAQESQANYGAEETNAKGVTQ